METRTELLLLLLSYVDAKEEWEEKIRKYSGAALLASTRSTMTDTKKSVAYIVNSLSNVDISRRLIKIRS